MRKRPLSLLFCALIFLYFPVELYWRWNHGEAIRSMDIILEIALPLILMVGLIRVTRIGWYTLIAMVSLWGVEDLYRYYASYDASISSLLIHLGIYCVSLTYFINPRVRHLYFDPKLRWWRTKPRYETHLPFLMRDKETWSYPILRNVSLGGCFIETAKPLEMNAKLHVTIPLPIPLNLSVIKAEGEVRWISRNPLRQGMGVQFQNPSRAVSQALREYVVRQL